MNTNRKWELIMLIELSKIKKCASDVVFNHLWIILNRYLLIFTNVFIAVKVVKSMEGKVAVLLIGLTSMLKKIQHSKLSQL